MNTHRTLSPNWKYIKQFFEIKKEKISTITINSPSAGLGNMGSTFFDIGFYLFNSKPNSAVGFLDDRKTPNPRGVHYKDPGGYGIIKFNKYQKLFFDLSEDTGLPYLINIKSKNYEMQIDEINNNCLIISRPKKMRIKPLYYYNFKPEKKILKLKHKFDVVQMTKYTIKKIFNKKFSYKNLQNAKKIMECIFGIYASSKEKKIIKFPLKKKYHNLNINFA